MNYFTTFHPNKDCKQYWQFSFYSYPQIPSLEGLVRKQEYLVQQVLDAIWDCELVLIPIIAYHSSQRNCGMRGTEDDPDPFIYRKRQVPPIFVRYSREHLWFEERFRFDNNLTPGMENWLNKTFTNHLEIVFNEINLQMLRRETYSDMCESMHKEIDRGMDNLDYMFGYINNYTFTEPVRK